MPFSNSSLGLPVGYVHVWHVNLDDPEAFVPQPPVLSTDELARANRLHFERDRLHFFRCRSLLRVLLGRYLQIPPSEIRFVYQSNGKLDLDVEQNPVRLMF